MTSRRWVPVAAMVPEFGRFPKAAALGRRDAELVALADAVVVVWPEREPGVLRLLALAKEKGIPVHVSSEVPAPRTKPLRGGEAPAPPGLPD